MARPFGATRRAGRGWTLALCVAWAPATATAAAAAPRAAAADYAAVVQVWARQAAAQAQRCDRFAVATVELWDRLEPIASNDVSWLPQALALFARYPGTSVAQQALHRALLHDLPWGAAPGSYETAACAPVAYAYGVRRMLGHLAYLPGHAPLRRELAELVLHKALHEISQPTAPLTLLAHLSLVGELVHAQLLRGGRHAERLYAAARAAVDEACDALGLHDADGVDDGRAATRGDVDAGARPAYGPDGPHPADELSLLEPGRQLLLQLVGEELLAGHPP